VKSLLGPAGEVGVDLAEGSRELAQGRYAEAEPLYNRSLAIKEKAFGNDHLNLVITLGNLAALYKSQGRYADAEPLYKRALAIREKALGPDHPDVATSLNNLGLLYDNQGRYAEAEPLYNRSLAIKEKAFGNDHLNLVITLGNPFGNRVDGLLGMSFLSRFNVTLSPTAIELTAIPLR
jgi:tetratricopeptide (TPR) repeat protein